MASEKSPAKELTKDLECCICMEVFISPTILSCGHMFCKSCINRWQKRVKRCPMCKEKIKSCVVLRNGDDIMDAVMGLVSTETQEKRRAAKRQREETVEPEVLSKKRKRNPSPDRARRQASSQQWREYVIAPEQFPFAIDLELDGNIGFDVTINSDDNIAYYQPN